jgi:hypothetical protein
MATGTGEAAATGVASHQRTDREWTQGRQTMSASVAKPIKGHLAGGELKEAWQCLKGWYKATFESTPPASSMVLAPQNAEQVALYGRVPLPGAPLPIHIDPAIISDGSPCNKELRTVVSGLRNGQALGTSRVQAKHIMVWLSNIVHEDK